MRVIAPPRTLQEQALAVHPICGWLIAFALLVAHLEVKVNVVDGDLAFSRKVLLGAGKEGLREKES